VLITGAGGFVGSRLVAELASRHEVVGLARRAGPPTEGVDWIEVDLSQPLDASRLPDRVDGIVHLAQSRRYREFPEGAGDVFAVNVASTVALLEYAREAGAQSFVFTSSGGVYGYSYERFVEEDPVNPLNFYFGSKYSAELLIGNYGMLLNTVVLRPFFVYGAGQKGMLVSNLVERVLRGETVTVEGDPGLHINPIHVDDAVRAFEPALTLGRSGLFNIAGDEVVTMTELVQLIGEVTGRTPSIAYGQAPSEGHLIGDNSAMKQVLGVEPLVSLREGLYGVAEALSAAAAR
jgi:UDP-glucose 4-epimerase